MNYNERLQRVIPGGAHTYSRGSDQFPENAPQILDRGEGAYVYDDKDNKFLDYGMALRAVNLGYANEAVNKAAWAQIEKGNNLTRASMIELEAAELFVDLIPSADMVKFTKNGSTATTAAVKLARAYTGKEMVLRCADHPFFSFDDWFIGSTVMNKGVPENIVKQTQMFKYNDIDSLKALIDANPDNIACLIMEPSTTEHPKDDFLHKAQQLCKDNGIVFILDEMITGFRWALGGAQQYYNIEPDLCTFGKAMANGFAVAALAGKREFMDLGGITEEGQDRVFLLSTTHGAEMCGLGAFIETINFIKQNNVIDHLWQYGEKLKQGMSELAKKHGVEDSFKMTGLGCSPNYLTLGKDGAPCFGLRTLFSQEMIKNGVLMPWIALSYAHQDAELEQTMAAVDKALAVYKKALDEGYQNYLVGKVIKPVFRPQN